MLPIAEHFHSIQGEGMYVGTPMHFIRLAGCNVGRANVSSAGEVPLLPVVGTPAYTCKSWDGREFYCDTDFKRHETLSLEALVEDTWEKHVCLTGGEPLMHQDLLNRERFFRAFADCGVKVHIETSGTIMFNGSRSADVWVTVAPKFGCLDDMIWLADEVKLVVDEHFDINSVPAVVADCSNVFVSPINNISTVRDDNLQRCYAILRKNPSWRLSAQWHKLIGAH